MERAYSIADDYDPDGETAGADPLTEYLTYLSHVHEGAVGDISFSLDDFKRYIAGLRK